MKTLIVVTVLLALAPTVLAAPIDFDNLHVASTAYGLAGNEGTTRLMAAYNNEIYFILSDDGTANPSKVCRYNPSDGLANTVNHSIVKETTGRFVTLRQINDLLYFSDTLGNVYSYDGSTLTPMSGTPFTANNYVSSIEEYNGSIYFGTSISSIYRYDGYTYEQVYVYGVSDPQAIVDMAAWQKDGYLYVSVGPRGICCPPTGYTIRSNSGNAGSWETVFQDVWHTTILMPTPDYLYTAVLDSAYCHCSTVRKSSEGTTFPVIYPSDGQYKVMWGSMYYNGIAYFFADDQMYGFGEIIIDDNGSVSRITNQNWMLTQAVELNGEIYALAGSHRYIPGGVYLITTSTLTVVSPDGDEEFVSGKTETITWQALDSIENVSIEYSTNNGLDWNHVNTVPNTGSYNWLIPNQNSNQCLVRITSAADANIFDTSDKVFTIFVCQLSSLGDLNKDCKVDFVDFAILAQDWLRNGNPFDENCSECPAGMVWVDINDPGIGGGHEGFNGQMSKYETTNAQYCQFLNAGLASGDITVDGNDAIGASGSNSGADYAGEVYYDGDGPGCNHNGAPNGGAARINYIGGVFSVDAGFENHPVTYDSWYGATAFCNYYGYRLPTEWEWQAVADYDGSFNYGCGTSINNSIANYYNSIHPDGTTIVGAFGTYGYGMCDLAGNVWEWTSSYNGSNYVTCGNSWGGYDYYASVSFRSYSEPLYTDMAIGFRVCR